MITGKEIAQYGEDYSVFSHVRGVALETVMRNAGGVLRAANHVRRTGEICIESIPDESGSGGYEYARERSPMERAIEDWLGDRDDHFLITWKNATRMKANRLVRERLGHSGPLPDEGEPVLIRKNGQGRMNGEVVVAGAFETGPTIGSVRTCYMTTSSGERLLVTVDGSPADKGGEFFDGGTPKITDWKRYHVDLQQGKYPEPLAVTWGYVLTCHAAQGGQARRTTVFLDRGDVNSSNFNKPTTLPDGRVVSSKARWTYTATTRATWKTTMVVGK